VAQSLLWGEWVKAMFLPKMTEVESSSIDSVGYDADTRELYIRFRENEKLYVYEAVDQVVFFDLMRAESKGLFVNHRIKGRYAYTELQ
jgi:hypothetical protein